MHRLNVVILCGGNGSRLWPLSRKKMPKQFLKLTDSNLTLLQLTVIRAFKLNPASVTVVVNELYNFTVKQQLDELKLDQDINCIKILSEPYSLNTGPAVAVASTLFKQTDNILILASDHVWEDNKFVEMIKEGEKLLSDNNIVFFGIKPKYPETGYGYIQTKDDNCLDKFIEKPNLDVATELFNKDNCLWNSGIFLFKNSSVYQYNPALFDYAKTVVSNTDNKLTVTINKELFSKFDNISVDYAVMERCTDGKVVTYNSFWSDIGSFNALYDFNKTDKSNCNVSIDTENCLIKSTGDRVIATIGVKDTVIVDTPDALLICKKDRCQEVKNIVQLLNGKSELTENKTEYRPWGFYTTLIGDDRSSYKVKKIVVYPEKKLSLQSHNFRYEHWVITVGEAKVTVGDSVCMLNSNEYVFIPNTVKHRIENIGSTDLEFVETQIGEYLGEDDIIRYEDDWNRV